MKTNLNYCIVLSSEQLTYLAGSKYGIDRMKILHQLIEAAVLKENDYAIKGFSTTLQVGQAILSEVDLSCKLGYDKKTISRVLNKMNQLGIVASTQNKRSYPEMYIGMDGKWQSYRQSFLCSNQKPTRGRREYRRTIQ